MAEVKLLPCPFCESARIFVVKFVVDEDYRAKCKDCKAQTGRYRTRQEAIAAWNTRKPDARLSELKDTLVKTIKMIEAHRDLTLISADHDPECQRAYSLMTDLTRAALSAAALFEQEKSEDYALDTDGEFWHT